MKPVKNWSVIRRNSASRGLVSLLLAGSRGSGCLVSWFLRLVKALTRVGGCHCVQPVGIRSNIGVLVMNKPANHGIALFFGVELEPGQTGPGAAVSRRVLRLFGKVDWVR